MAALVPSFPSLRSRTSGNVECSSSRLITDNRNLSTVAATGGSPIQTNPTLRTSVPGHQASFSRRGFSQIQNVSLSDVSPPMALSDLPLREIPGSYGPSFLGIGAIKDRLDWHWFQGVPKFYQARKDKYNSTVYRTNVPPGPPFFPDPRVIVLLDQQSYPALFDLSKVEKKDVFVGTWMPSVELTGGYRVLSYLDPSEPKHAQLKEFSFEILKGSGPRIFPEFAAAYSEVFASLEASLKNDGKVQFDNDLRRGSFKFVLKAYTKRDPFEAGENSLDDGVSSSRLWLLSQIAPICRLPVPLFLAPLVELFLHTFRVPPPFVKGSYTKLVKFFRTYATDLLDMAENKLSLDREEALHNLLFLTIFNTFGGLDILFPSILKRLGTTSRDYQKELSAEVRKAVKDNGGRLSPQALGAMPLVQSAVYEVFRIDPPVAYQYARAKEDFILESHDAAFQVKKGEVLAGYMPVASRDPKVFKDAESFLPKRFLGEEGKALVRYVLWSNGPQTEEPTVNNKHCAGKNFIVTVAQLFVATIYAKYETLLIDPTDNTLLTTLARITG